MNPRFEGFRVIGTFNPGAVRFGDEVALLVRVVEQPAEQRPGQVALPYWDLEHGRAAIQWWPEEDLEWSDPRIVRLRPDGRIRLLFLSYLLTAFSRDGLSIDRFGPAFLPATAYETFGVEDPRLTWLDGRYYFTYVGVSEHGIVTALASTERFETFQRHGIIFCPENKDVLLFPERIGGQFVAMHRPNPNAWFSPPEIWLARSPDLIHWGGHRRLLGAKEVIWATVKIGGGTPPIRTERGWLSLLHGHIRPGRLTEVGAYAAASLLLDLQRPERIVTLSPQPVMVAQEPFERLGFLSDIVFPTALVPRGEEVDVYYGAADTATGVARYAVKELT